MGHVNRPRNASTALLASTALNSGTLGYGTTTRSGTGATYTDQYGVIRSAPANTPRINNSTLTGSNLFRNPWFSGAVVGGSPLSIVFLGQLPAGGLTATVVGAGTLTSGIASGMPYVDIRLAGNNTTGTTLLYQLYPEGGNFIAGFTGETFTISAYMQVIAGNIPPGITIPSPGFDERSAGAHVSYNFSNGSSSISTVMQRITRTVTIATGGIDALQPGWWISCQTGYTPVDMTIRIAGWQFERGSTATVVSYPPPGTLATSANFQSPRLLVEEGRTNSVVNPRGEGSTVGTLGSGGVLPTGWGIFSASGLSTAVVGTGTMAGRPYVDIRFFGTSTNTFYVMNFGAAVASPGNVFTTSFAVAMVGGSLANINAVYCEQRFTANTVDVAFTGLNAGTWSFASATGTGDASTANAYPCLYINMPNGVAIDITLRIGAPQMEQGPFATSLILPPAGSPAATTRQTDVVNVNTTPLFKYGTPIVNLALQSQTFDNATWGKAQATVTADAIAAPDGTVTADKLVTDATTNNHAIVQTITSLVAGQWYTQSLYVKAAEYAFFRLGTSSGPFGTGNGAIYFNAGTGTVDVFVPAAGTQQFFTVQALQNGWYRISLTTLCTTSGADNFAISVSATAGFSTLGDGTSGGYIWGAQYEVSQSLSGYVATTGTVSAPRAKIAPGTLVVKSRLFNTPPAGAVWGVLTISDGTANNRLGLRLTSTGLGIVAIAGNVTRSVSIPAIGVPQPATTYAFALSWDDTTTAVGANGSAVETPTVTPPTGVNLLSIGAGTNGSFYTNGEFDSVVYYPYKMTVAQLQAATT